MTQTDAVVVEPGEVLDLEPPGTKTALAQDDTPGIEIRVQVTVPKFGRLDTGRNLAPDASAVAIASSLVDCIRAVATMIGPGVEYELRRWVSVE
jgi:hypothetical protein